QIEAGTAKGVKQDKSQATKAPKLKKEDGLIDWRRTPRQICDQIRAMQPWPTAYTFLHREGKPPVRVIVNKATVPTDYLYCDVDAWSSQPGEMLMFPEPSRLSVTTSEATSIVEILELQPAGKKRMAATEFLRGRPVQPGDRFGPETP